MNCRKRHASRRSAGPRRRTAFWALGAVAAAASMALLVGAAGRPETATKPAEVLTVATYNINWANRDLATVAQTIRTSAADLVCLQETNRASAAYLRRVLGREYRFMHFQGQGRASFGVLSKSRLRNVRYLRPKFGYFGTQVFQVQLGGKQVQVANVHLQPTGLARGIRGFLSAMAKAEATRAAEIRRILAALPPGAPALLLGDLNCPPSFSAARLAAEGGFADSFIAAGADANAGATWRMHLRDIEWKFRVDYIFHSRHFNTLRSRVIESNASDHYLVVSKLRWSPAPAATQPAGHATSRRAER